MRYLYCIFLLVSLVGCTTVSYHPAETFLSSNKAYSSGTKNLLSWDMQGAIAVKTNQKGWNASFNWSQRQANYHLTIFGPLGSNRISLTGNNEHAILTTAERTYEATNAEVLLEQRLGWYIPVNSIYYWVRGLPAPGAISHKVRNAEGQLIAIDQQGWHIEYQSYDKINGLNLPTLIELRNSKVFIRIAIHQWIF
jgi:outer membrane lipoprotein LolB